MPMKKLFNFRPLSLIAISLCCGIAAAYFLMRSNYVWAVIFIAFFLSAVSASLIFFSGGGKRKRNFIFCSVLSAFFVFGGAEAYFQLNAFENANLGNHYYEVSGKVTAVYVTDSSSKLIVKDVFVDGNVKGRLKYNLALYVYGDNSIDVGDSIAFSAYLKDNSCVYEDNFNASDVERGIKYSASVNAADISVTGNSLTVFERVNLFMRDALRTGLDDGEFSVAYAMLAGDSSYIDYDVLTAFRTAGVAHIFAVSGLHIGFLAVAVGFLLKKLKIRGYKKAVIIGALLFFYSGVCGFSASSLRAAIMVTTSAFAAAGGKRYDGLSAISFACALILCFSPIQLFCVGFQLSFAVVSGILLLSKPIARLLKFLPKKFADSLGVVFSAQLAAVPISLYHFGKISWIAVAANLVFIPVVSVIFTVTLVATFIGGIFGIETVALFIPGCAFKLINFCITVFDEKIFMISGFAFGGATVLYYFAAVLLSGLVNISKKIRRLVSLACVMVMIFGTVAVNVSDNGSVKAYVCGSDKICATFVYSSKDSALIVSSAESGYSVSRLKRIADKAGVSEIDVLIFTGGCKVDMQVFMTRLYTVFSVKRVCYYGARDEATEKIIEKSFSVFDIRCYADGEALPVKTFSCAFALDGLAVSGTCGDKKTVIFSSFTDENVNLASLDSDYDVMVCLDSAEQLISYYNPPVGICYRSSYVYDNAESNGNLFLKLS